MEFHCTNCIKTEEESALKKVLPVLHQVNRGIGVMSSDAPKVCLRASQFMSMFKYLVIDPNNQILKLNLELRQILVSRRKLHKLFDMVKCQFWQTFFDSPDLKGKTKDCQHLVLREIVLKWDDLIDLYRLRKRIEGMIRRLEAHINKECLICDDKAVKCPMNCHSNHPKFSRTTLKDV